MELRISLHYVGPVVPPDCVAFHVCLTLVEEKESLQEATLESSNDGARSKLLAIPFYLVYFIPNIVQARENEYHFTALVELLVDHLSFFIKSNLEVLHYEGHKF
jgi:hypothetical protein